MFFGFSLIGHMTNWLQYTINGTLHTWKELEYKFLERYYSNAQFLERKTTISNFAKKECESLFDAWERFNLLLPKCLNHNMSVIEHMTHFID